MILVSKINIKQAKKNSNNNIITIKSPLVQANYPYLLYPEINDQDFSSTEMILNNCGRWNQL